MLCTTRVPTTKRSQDAAHLRPPRCTPNHPARRPGNCVWPGLVPEDDGQGRVLGHQERGLHCLRAHSHTCARQGGGLGHLLVLDSPERGARVHATNKRLDTGRMHAIRRRFGHQKTSAWHNGGASPTRDLTNSGSIVCHVARSNPFFSSRRVVPPRLPNDGGARVAEPRLGTSRVKPKRLAPSVIDAD